MIDAQKKYLSLDLNFRLVAQFGYNMLKPGRPTQFLVASRYRATTKLYSADICTFL